MISMLRIDITVLFKKNRATKIYTQGYQKTFNIDHILKWRSCIPMETVIETPLGK